MCEYTDVEVCKYVSVWCVNVQMCVCVCDVGMQSNKRIDVQTCMKAWMHRYVGVQV